MIRAVFNCLSNLSPISRRGTPKEQIICHLYLCVLSDDLYTRVEVAIELYYKCVGTPPFLKKIAPGLFALLVEVNFSFHFHSLTPVGIQSSSFICLLMLSSRISALFFLHIL